MPVTPKPKRLFARQASISFSVGSNQEAINYDAVRAFVDEAGSDLVEWTRRGSNYQSWRSGRVRGSVELIIDADDKSPGTSHIPMNTVGKLTITANKADGAHQLLSGPFVFRTRRRTAPAFRIDGRQELTYTGHFVEDLSASPQHLTETP